MDPPGKGDQQPRELVVVGVQHLQGLGVGDPRDIELVGDTDAINEKWDFEGPFKNMTFASKNQHRIYWGPLKKPIEWSLKTWLRPGGWASDKYLFPDPSVL